MQKGLADVAVGCAGGVSVGRGGVTEGVDSGIAVGEGAGVRVGDAVSFGMFVRVGVACIVSVGMGGDSFVARADTGGASVASRLDGVGATVVWDVALQARVTKDSTMRTRGERRQSANLACVSQLAWRGLGFIYPNEHYPNVVFAACCIGRRHELLAGRLHGR